MLSRRSFVASAAIAVSAVPHVAHAVTDMPVANSWPAIHGPGVDPQRTRFIVGRGIRTQPTNLSMNCPELSFVHNTEENPSMALTHGLVLACAMGPELPLVAMDAGSGELAWQRKRTLKILGVSDELVFIVTAPESEDSMALLKAVDVTGPTDLWAVGEDEIAGSVVVPGKALVYSREFEDQIELVARDLATGEIKWTVDTTDDVGEAVGTLSTDGNIVVGDHQTTNISRIMPAWDAATGELLWMNEGPGFISSPTFYEGRLVVATVESVKLLDPTSGEIVREFELPEYIGGLVKLIVTEEALILVDSQHIHSIDWDSGAVNWSRAPRLAPATREIYACDGLILRLEKATATSFRETTLRGYSLEDGRLELEYVPVDAEQNELSAAAFLVGSQRLFLATDKGLGTWFPSEEELIRPNDPMMDQEFAHHELGFSYSWDEEWEALGSNQMTPNGLLLGHADHDKYVAQFAGPRSESDLDFTSTWHAFFGPYDNSILSAEPADAPSLSFVPQNAQIVAVTYQTTLNGLAENCFGVRVLIPLAGDNRLVFEYLQFGMDYESGIKSFRSFFDKLSID